MILLCVGPWTVLGVEEKGVLVLGQGKSEWVGRLGRVLGVWGPADLCAWRCGIPLRIHARALGAICVRLSPTRSLERFGAPKDDLHAIYTARPQKAHVCFDQAVEATPKQAFHRLQRDHDCIPDQYLSDLRPLCAHWACTRRALQGRNLWRRFASLRLRALCGR